MGTLTAAGAYKLTDVAYSKLLHKLQTHLTELPQELRSNIFALYRDPGGSAPTTTNDPEWGTVLQELDRLRSVDVDLRRPPVATVERPYSCGRSSGGQCKASWAI